ncbi:MAG: HlyD family efflux transporter periplasmic adaptor subunit [Microcystis aeruginosa LG13-11]|jgi:HlyD family secretion protein|nr:HlyD family efflux transporter periplasmic adaptor subunit [Microcystis aeruginosa LG13-11]
MSQVRFKPKAEPEFNRLDFNPFGRKFLIKGLLISGFIVTGIAGALWYFSQPKPLQLLRISGRIEGYETDIGAKVPGRLKFIAVREGDKVEKGQVIVRQDDDEIKAELEEAKAQISASQQQVNQSALQIKVLESQIQELEISIQQARDDAQGQILEGKSSLASSEAQLIQAQAQLEQVKAELELAQIDHERFASLITEGVISQQQFDQTLTILQAAKANVKAREASVESFQKLVDAAKGQLTRVQTSALNPQIRRIQLQSLRTQLAQARSQLAQSQAELAQTKAREQQIKARVVDLRIVSPIDGIVTARSVEPGAVVSAGKTLLTLLDPQTVYLRAYVPAGEIGKLKVGQKANVFLDSAPEQAFSGKISAIDTQASFTPENIYFQEDRVKQVFGIKISIDDPRGLVKPGMPADAEIPEVILNQ